MSRPEHLGIPNTSEGIRRINEMQEVYDRDPEAYEIAEQEARRAEEERNQYEIEQQAQAEQAQAEQAQMEYENNSHS